MTTINNAAVNETVETAAVAPVAAVRNTLKSTLEAGNHEALAAILFNMGDAEFFKALNDTWKEAAKLVPQMHKDAAKLAKDAAAKREADKAAIKAEREAAKDAALADLKEQQDKMLKMLMEDMGLDKDAAIIAVEAAMKQKRKAIETASVREQVQINVNGVTHTMPRKGNMSQALKDLVTDSGLTKEAFIEKYEVKAGE